MHKSFEGDIEMNSFIKRAISLVSAVVILVGLTVPASAHPGRTDSSGGHRDNISSPGLCNLMVSHKSND